MNNEFERCRRSVKALSWHLPRGLRKSTGHLSQDSQSSEKCLKLGPPEYEAAVLNSDMTFSLLPAKNSDHI
jgi:hypothetical protein